MKENSIEIINYRGYSVPIFYDDAGQSFYCTLDNKEISFGSFNTEYEEDLKYLIDEKLDLIAQIPEYAGARLKKFKNGYYEDIQLIYRGRVLKVYLVNHEISEISLDYLMQDSLKVLRAYRQNTENEA